MCIYVSLSLSIYIYSYTRGRDGLVKKLDLTSEDCKLLDFAAAGAEIQGLVFCLDQDVIVAASKDNVVKMCEVSGARSIDISNDHFAGNGISAMVTYAIPRQSLRFHEFEQCA